MCGGFIFVLWTKMEQVDAVFSSMHFERMYLKKDYYHGYSTADLCRTGSAPNVNREYARCENKMQKLLEGDGATLTSFCTGSSKRLIQKL